MKSAVETLSPTRAKLTVEVPFEELKPSLDAAYQSIASQITVPGFRKGKVPPQVIDQRVGRGPVLEVARAPRRRGPWCHSPARRPSTGCRRFDRGEAPD